MFYERYPYLMHHGVKGQRWGFIRNRDKSSSHGNRKKKSNISDKTIKGTEKLRAAGKAFLIYKSPKAINAVNTYRKNQLFVPNTAAVKNRSKIEKLKSAGKAVIAYQFPGLVRAVNTYRSGQLLVKKSRKRGDA